MTSRSTVETCSTDVLYPDRLAPTHHCDATCAMIDSCVRARLREATVPPSFFFSHASVSARLLSSSRFFTSCVLKTHLRLLIQNTCSTVVVEWRGVDSGGTSLWCGRSGKGDKSSNVVHRPTASFRTKRELRWQTGSAAPTQCHHAPTENIRLFDGINSRSVTVVEFAHHSSSCLSHSPSLVETELAASMHLCCDTCSKLSAAFFVLGLTQRVTSLSHAFANISYLIVTKGKLVMCYGRDRLNT